MWVHVFNIKVMKRQGKYGCFYIECHGTWWCVNGCTAMYWIIITIVKSTNKTKQQRAYSWIFKRNAGVKFMLKIGFFHSVTFFQSESSVNRTTKRFTFLWSFWCIMASTWSNRVVFGIVPQTIQCVFFSNCICNQSG